MRRDLTTSALIAVTLLTIVPAYQRVFDGPGWRGAALGAAGAALLLATLVRRLHGGAWIAGALSAIAFAGTAPWLVGLEPHPMLPGRETLTALGGLFEVARHELAVTPSPAPPLTGLLLLVAAGWWAVAHLAHELATRWHRPVAGLLAATVLYTVPLAVPPSDATSLLRTVPFFAMAALVLLLSANTADAPGASRRAVSAGGLLAGGLAVVLAVTVPGLLPGHEQAPWVQLGQGASPRGYQPIVDVSNRLNLPEERDVLRVHASQRTYLRLAGLDSFDGDAWRIGPATGGTYRPDPAALFPADRPLPPEHQAARTETVQVDVEVLDLENIYVPVPYQPVEILGPLRDEMVWSTEGGFLATSDTVDASVTGRDRIGIRQGVEYRVRAERPAPTFEELTDVVVDPETRARFTALPRDYPELEEQALEIYAAAGATTDIERALALQGWFTGPDGGFTYDLDVDPLRGEAALTDFVLRDRVGYCEYFASAMAVMLRQTGVPARVATGFLPGRVTRAADPGAGAPLTEYTVSTADAHAWVEVLFPGWGWITFEPTPRSDDTHVAPTADDLAPVENAAERREREAAGPTAQTLPPAEPAPPEGDPVGTSPADAQANGPRSEVGGGRATRLLLSAGGLVVLLGLGMTSVSRRRRPGHLDAASPRGQVLAAQRSLLATAARHGLPRGAHETTREVVERWWAEDRIDERGRTFARVAQSAAFGGEVTAEEAVEVDRLVADLEGMLRASVPAPVRLMAPARPLLDAAVGAWRAIRHWSTRSRRPVSG